MTRSKRSTRWSVIAIAVVVVVAGAVIVVNRANSSRGDHMDHAEFSGPPVSFIERAGTGQLSPKDLVGTAKSLIVGVVTSKLSTTDRDGTPWTRYSVDVKEVLKGERIDVIDTIGGNDKSGVLHLIRGATFPQLGVTYLFATQTSSKNGTADLIPGSGAVLINGPESEILDPDGILDEYRALLQQPN